MMEGSALRTRSILALLVVVGLMAGCGGGGGGPVESAGRADAIPITLSDCGGTPGAIINGAFFKVTLARDDFGGMLSAADYLKDAQGTATLISGQQAKFVSDSGKVTGTLTLQTGPLPSC
jgi:hypothetical protein